MSNLITRPLAPHLPVQRQGKKPGSVHAALRGVSGWHTACGEYLHDSPRGPIVRLSIREVWELIDADSPLICRRCARAGDAVDR